MERSATAGQWGVEHGSGGNQVCILYIAHLFVLSLFLTSSLSRYYNFTGARRENGGMYGCMSRKICVNEGGQRQPPTRHGARYR